MAQPRIVFVNGKPTVVFSQNTPTPPIPILPTPGGMAAPINIYTPGPSVPSSNIYTPGPSLPIQSGYTGTPSSSGPIGGGYRIVDSGPTTNINTGGPRGQMIEKTSSQRWVDSLLPDEQVIWQQGMARGDSPIEVMNRIGKMRRARGGRGGGPTGLSEDEKRAAIALDKRLGKLQKQQEDMYEQRGEFGQEAERLRNRGPMIKPQGQTPDALERKVEQKKQNRENRIKEIDQKLGSLNAEMDKLMGNRSADDLSDAEYRHMWYLTYRLTELSDERKTLVQRTEKKK